MYHTAIDVKDDNIKIGDIAHMDVNPLYIDKEIIRLYN